MGPGSAGHGQWDELAYGDMTQSFGQGTDRTTSDVPVDVPGHTGATSIEPGGARGSVGCLGVQSLVLRVLSPEGVDTGRREHKSSLLGSPAEQVRSEWRPGCSG